MKGFEMFWYSGIEKKASKAIYKRFGINNKELNILVCLSAFLMIHDKRIINRQDFSTWLGLNWSLEKKVWGYLAGLINKGAIHRLAYRRPDGNCLTISGFGVNVLEAFDSELNAIQKAEKIKFPHYRELAINPEDLPKGYTLMQRGRDI